MTNQRSSREIGAIQRSILVGAAVGLYFGTVGYKPYSGETFYGTAIILSFLAALVTVAVQYFKDRPPVPILLKKFVTMFLLYSIFLLAMAARQWASQVGGRWGVALLTTCTGSILGYFWSSRRDLFR